MLSTPPWLAYVKISEGCDYTCSFCIIPKLRGRHRSRSVEDIVSEARALAARGVREIVLVAQDSTRYGLDHGVRDGLAYLLRRLGRVDGIRWIRVMYAYPSTLSDKVLDAIASEEKVVKYVDIPLQHASEAGAQADEAADRQRQPARDGGEDPRAGAWRRGPHVVHRRLPRARRMRTSRSSLEFVEAGRFDNVGVFTFSDEEGTTSWDLPGRVPARVKESRKRKLMSLQKRLSLRRNRARVGERVEVLVEGTHPDSDLLLRGRLATQAPEIDGQVIVNDGTAEPGSFVTCEVTEAHHYDLVARVV